MNTLEISELITYDKTICSPEWEVKETFPTFHRFYYVYSGEVLYESREEKFFLEKGYLYIFPVYKEHRMTHNPSNAFQCLWFHVKLNYTLLNNVIRIQINEGTTLYYLMKALEKLITGKSPAYTVKNILNSILFLTGQDTQYIFASDPRLEAILQYIYKNYQTGITNFRLASIANLDIRYFIRFFKKNLGQTPGKYLSAYRAFQAANYLLQGLSVKETAAMTGFEDVKAFSRFFKSYKGIPPSQYKHRYYLQP